MSTLQLAALERLGAEHLNRLILMTRGVFTDRSVEFLRGAKVPCLEKPLRPELLERLLAERVSRRTLEARS